MKKQNLYGMMGLLSLLGFVGVFTEERGFLGFFGFAVDFQYFFIKSDEMLEEYMTRSAARAFFAGMLVTAAAAFGALVLAGAPGNRALAAGFAAGWAAAVVVYSLSTAYYGFRENWGLEHD